MSFFAPTRVTDFRVLLRPLNFESSVGSTDCAIGRNLKKFDPVELKHSNAPYGVLFSYYFTIDGILPIEFFLFFDFYVLYFATSKDLYCEKLFSVFGDFERLSVIGDTFRHLGRLRILPECHLDGFSIAKCKFLAAIGRKYTVPISI
jgi:hypothetical protein